MLSIFVPILYQEVPFINEKAALTDGFNYGV